MRRKGNRPLNFLAAWALGLATVLLGCRGTPVDLSGPTATTPPVDLAGLSVENYPIVNGSTSALPLQQMVACHVFMLECDWQPGFLFDVTRSILPDFEDPGSQAEAEYLFNLRHNGTHDAYMNLIRGNADLILVARQPSQDEINAARLRGVSLDVRPVALDAFVFLVNTANPVESLTVDQIRQIYTGEITAWEQLDVDLSAEENTAISTYQRDRNSGSQELMESLVMRGEKLVESPDMLLYEMVGPFNAIGGDVLGIGYSVYYYAAYMLPTETVRLLSVEGVLPTAESIAGGSYPFVTEVYVVIREDTPLDGTAVQLRNWLLSQEGQTVVAKSGYIPAVP